MTIFLLLNRISFERIIVCQLQKINMYIIHVYDKQRRKECTVNKFNWSAVKCVQNSSVTVHLERCQGEKFLGNRAPGTSIIYTQR